MLWVRYACSLGRGRCLRDARGGDDGIIAFNSACVLGHWGQKRASNAGKTLHWVASLVVVRNVSVTVAGIRCFGSMGHNTGYSWLPTFETCTCPGVAVLNAHFGCLKVQIPKFHISHILTHIYTCAPGGPPLKTMDWNEIMEPTRPG